MKGVCPCEATLYQKSGNFWYFGAAFPIPAPIEVKFCKQFSKQTKVPVGRAKFDENQCNESPLWGEKPDFWPVSKFNTGSLPLWGILPVNMWRQMIHHLRLCASTIQYVHVALGRSATFITKGICHYCSSVVCESWWPSLVLVHLPAMGRVGFWPH